MENSIYFSNCSKFTILNVTSSSNVMKVSFIVNRKVVYLVVHTDDLTIDFHTKGDFGYFSLVEGLKLNIENRAEVRVYKDEESYLLTLVDLK